MAPPTLGRHPARPGRAGAAPVPSPYCAALPERRSGAATCWPATQPRAPQPPAPLPSAPVLAPPTRLTTPREPLRTWAPALADAAPAGQAVPAGRGTSASCGPAPQSEAPPAPGPPHRCSASGRREPQAGGADNRRLFSRFGGPKSEVEGSAVPCSQTLEGRRARRPGPGGGWGARDPGLCFQRSRLRLCRLCTPSCARRAPCPKFAFPEDHWLRGIRPRPLQWQRLRSLTCARPCFPGR